MLKQTRWSWLLVCVLGFSLLAAGCTKQAKMERHLKRANAYYDAKDFKKAEVEYINTVRLSGTNTWAFKRLAAIYEEEGKTIQELRMLHYVSTLEKDNLEVRVKLGDLFLAVGHNLPAARTNAIYVLDRSPTNDSALLLLADCAVTPPDVVQAQQRLTKAQPVAGNRALWNLAQAMVFMRQTNTQAGVAALGRALALDPDSSRVHTAWGNYHLREAVLQKKAGDQQRGEQEFQKADQEFQKAAELAPGNSRTWLNWVDFRLATRGIKPGTDLLRQLTEKKPGYTPALAKLAQIDFETGNYQESSNVVQKILLQDPVNYQARLLDARFKFGQGKIAEVIKELGELKRDVGSSAELETELASAHLKNNDLASATTSLREALRLDPNYPQAILMSARISVAKGDPESAVGPLQNLVAKQPKMQTAQLLLATAYMEQKRFDEALVLYRTLEKDYPTNASFPFAIGGALRGQGKRPEARASFQRALALAPADPGIVEQLLELDLGDKNYPAAMQLVQGLLAAKPRSAVAKVMECDVFMAQTNLASAEAALQQAIEWEPTYTKAYVTLMRIYLISGKVPEAIAKIQQMIEKNPKSVGALKLLAELLDRNGEPEKAAQKYQEFLKVAPQSAEAWNDLAWLYSEKLGKPDQAMAAATKARELNPQSPNIADTVGWVYFRHHDYARALTFLQEAAAKLGEKAEVQYHVGMTEYMLGHKDLAQAALKRSLDPKQKFLAQAEAKERLATLDLNPEAIDSAAAAKLQERLKQQPDDLFVLLLLGKYYEKTGDSDKARQTLEDARKASPNCVPVLVQLAELEAFTLKDTKQALLLAREARKLAPEDPAVAHVLGRLADQSGDHQWAASLLQESAQKLPGDGEVLFDLAHATYAIGRVSEAEEIMKRAQQVGSLSHAQEAQSFMALAAFYRSADKRLESEPQVQALLKARPDYLPVLVVSGLINEQRGRVPEARQAYEKVLELSPLFAPARKQLAGLYTEQLNDQQKAWDYATKAREALPEDADLAFTMGKIAYRRADYTGSLRFLQQAAPKRPSDFDLLYFQGMSEYKLKQKTESKRDLNAALAINPNSPLAADIKKALADLK